MDNNLHGNKCYLKKWGIKVHREAVQVNAKQMAVVVSECTEACLQKSVWCWKMSARQEMISGKYASFSCLNPFPGIH